MKPEAVFYMMLFCAILLTRSRGVALADSLRAIPLFGGARALADQLATKPSR